MQVIRQYAVPKNGVLTIEVPQAFNGQQIEVQLVLADEVATAQPTKPNKRKKKTTGLEKLVGSLMHLTSDQNENIDQELAAIRNEWERPIF